MSQFPYACENGDKFSAADAARLSYTCDVCGAAIRPSSSQSVRAVLDSQQLEALDARLRVRRAERVATSPSPPDPLRTATPGSSADEQAQCAEIVDLFKRGVSIASQIESYPLLPLYELKKLEVPAEIQVATQSSYVFYLVEIVFSILLGEREFARRAEFRLEIDDGTKPGPRRSRPFRLFPEHADVTYFSADVEGSVGVDADMHFQVPKLENRLLTATAAANAQGKLTLVLGPYGFKFRKAAIDVVGTSQNAGYIGWRYNLESQLNGANEFKSMIIMKVPQEVERIQLKAQLKVDPWRTHWSRLFQQELEPLTAATRLDVELRPTPSSS